MKGILIMICVILGGCTSNTYHVYSLNKEQCITIINKNNFRYIIDGYNTDIPEKNYVKINLSEIDRGVGDEMVGCWNKNNFQWIILMNNVIVLENKLDKRRFKFQKKFPRDEFNIPTTIEYDRNKLGCFSVSFDYGKLIRSKGAIEIQ